MKTQFNDIHDPWKLVKNHCRTTVNKVFTDKEPNEEFKRKLLISEHSPIRLITIDWTWEDIYSWVSVHWSRHKFEKFISTQRDDRVERDILGFDPVWLDEDGNEHHPYKTRNDAPQGTLVRFDGYANMQNLIDSFRKRLCFQASDETRQLAEDFKVCLHEVKPVLADVLVPNCIYRCGCPEFEMCKQKFFENFIDHYDRVNPIITENFYRIQERYTAYNEWFYGTHKVPVAKEDTV